MSASIPQVPSIALWRNPKPPMMPDPEFVRAGRAAATLSVLLVDDEALIRWSLRRVLNKRGHDVVEAADAGEALRALGRRHGAFDVVLLDYRLPDRQDSSMLQDVRRLAPRSVIYMMTAYGDAAMRAQSHALGARAVIDKPFQLDAFVTMIESAFDTSN